MGPGKMLGLEDIARLSKHSYTAKCVSQTGTILKMDVDKFHIALKHISNGFSELTRLNKKSWRTMYEKLT